MIGRPASLTATIVLVALAGVLYFLSDRRHHGAAAEKEASSGEGPVAQVKTTPVEKGSIQQTIRVYGSVIPAPGALTTISVPYECRVHRIMVNEGQEVSKGDVLLEIGPSPDERLKYDQAIEVYDAAKQALDNVNRKFRLRLATNDQVLSARQASDQARLTLESMKREGVGEKRELRAERMGLVNKVAVDQGAIAAPGAPLLQIVPRDRLELRLGVEPEDIGKVRTGVAVDVSLASEGRPVAVGRVRKVSHSVNPSTRLVDVFVSLPSPSRFLLGQYVSATIAVASIEGLIVPKSAVLPGGKAPVLYVVESGRARTRQVRTIAEGKNVVAVEGPGLREGDAVVTLGNYELKDNMRVAVEAGR